MLRSASSTFVPFSNASASSSTRENPNEDSARGPAGVIAFALMAAPATASAARSGNVDDPADAQPTVSGTPDNPDVQHVTVTHDAGTIAITASFYNALNA